MAYEEEYKMAEQHGLAALEVLRNAFKHEQECKAEEPDYDPYDDIRSFSHLMSGMELFIESNITSCGLNFTGAEFRYGPDVFIYPMFKRMEVMEVPITFRISLCEDEEMLEDMVEFAYDMWRRTPKCGSEY